MFNLKLPTPDELKEFQIENYTELMKNPLSSNHKKFLKSQLKNLNNGNDQNFHAHAFRGNRYADNIVRDHLVFREPGT